MGYSHIAARCPRRRCPIGSANVTAGASSIPEVRRLLAVLAASKPTGRLAEIGAAFGEGAKAIAESMGPEATFVTVEPDPERYTIASSLLAGTRAEILNARWEDVLPERAPFDLLFFDGGTRAATLAQVVALLAPGGLLVKDDLTPGHPVEGDPVREAFLHDDRLVAIELLTTPTTAAIVATRRN
jgi:predicted O-methyltransferase YrrM